MESGGWKAGKRLTTKWTRMVTEGTRPQNNLSEAGSRLKLHKTDIHHTFSSLIICPECMNLVTALQNLAVPICIFQMVSLLLYRVELFYCRHVGTIVCQYYCQYSKCTYTNTIVLYSRGSSRAPAKVLLLYKNYYTIKSSVKTKKNYRFRQMNI